MGRRFARRNGSGICKYYSVYIIVRCCAACTICRGGMTLVTDRDVLLRRLQWRATRRGLLELDEWFSRFLKRDFETLSDAECETFVLLLEEPDPHLYAW